MLPDNFNIPITVSLTSFPPRINVVGDVVKSILSQTVKPDRVLLWLAEDQFPGRESDLPSALTDLCNSGLTIRWCDDIRPHKKYFYTMQEFPESIVITVDDDVVYKPELVETLVNSYIKFPFAVSALRAHRITFDENGCMKPYEKWERGIKTAHYPSHALIATGVCGVLYPPHCFGEEAFNKEFIKENCINADDLWQKIMELKYNVPVVLAAPSEDVKTIRGSQAEALYKSNDLADQNDIQFRNILSAYNHRSNSGYSLQDCLRISSLAFDSDAPAGGEAAAAQIKLLQKELAAVKGSSEYRIGRILTLVPRAAKTFLCCVQDNGLGYTFKLILKKLRHFS